MDEGRTVKVSGERKREGRSAADRRREGTGREERQDRRPNEGRKERNGSLTDLLLCMLDV